MFGRRKAKDPAFEQVRAAFSAVAVAVDGAQRALLAAVPTPRDDGLPLGQALADFRAALKPAREAMPAWRDPRTEDVWQACAQGIHDAEAEAEQMRLSTAQLTFEALNERIGDVLHPLEAFVDADRSIRRL